MLKGLIKRARYADFLVLASVFVLLSFFVIGNGMISEQGNGGDGTTQSSEINGGVQISSWDNVLDNGNKDAVDSKSKASETKNFIEDTNDSVYVRIEDINNNTNSAVENDNLTLTVGNETNTLINNRDSGEIVSGSSSNGENIEGFENKSVYLNLSDVNGVSDIEIPSNSVTLESEISNRHSRTKGDTINGNVYSEDKSENIYKDESGIENKTIPYLYFDNNNENKKIYEFDAEASKSEEINNIVDGIDRTEIIKENEGEWKKEVVLNSSKHVDREFVTYADVVESPKLKEKYIKIFWEEGNKEIDFETYDSNNNNLVDRVSWVVPHLSKQTFQIIIDLKKDEMSNSSIIVLETKNAPYGTLNKTDVYFNFSASYYNASLVNCNFGIIGSEISENRSLDSSSLNYAINLENGNYSWNLNCFDMNNITIQNSTYGNFAINVDYTPIIEFNSDKNLISKGESVSFTVNITAVVISNISYVIDYGDSTNAYSSLNNFTKSLYINLPHPYNFAGNFIARLSVYLDSSTSPFVRTKIIIVNLSQQSDSEKPVVTLIEPEDNKNIKIREINFSYKASDNINLSNCTFNLYYYNNSQIGKLTYTKTNSTEKNDEEVKIALVDFDGGDYSWEVGCYDKNGNYKEEGRDFNVNLGNITSLVGSSSTLNQVAVSKQNLNGSFEGKEKIDILIQNVNDFLIKEEKYSSEEKEAIQDLGIDEKLDFYKKRLLQMKVDLQSNLDYVRDASLREERRKGIFDEIDNMTKGVPTDLRVVNSYEYYKNSLKFDLGEVVDSYVNASNIVLDEKGKRDMALENGKIQKYIGVSVKARQVEIDYEDKTEKITLVSKKIDFKNKSFDSIIEVVPKEVALSSSEINFLGIYRIIKEDPIFEVKLENIKDDKIVYYINKIIDSKEIEKTTTLVFKEEIPKGQLSGITGFATFISGQDKNVWFYISWVLTLAILASIFIFGYKKAQITRWKKDEKVKEIFVLIRKTKREMEKKNVEKAREFYQKVKEIYSSIPNNCRKYVYNRMEKLRVEIDKKDIASLVKEFISAVKETRKDDALMLYNKINKVYKKLPEKYRSRVYNKISPVVKELKKN